MSSTSKRSTSPLEYVRNVIVGALIGLAELIPGVSGGTVALVTGIYGRALDNGSALIDIVKTAFTRKADFKAQVAKVEWLFLITIGIGMVAMVLTMSGVMSGFVENSPEVARALFMGMVAVSIYVPFQMMRNHGIGDKAIPAAILFILAAIALFFLTGLTSAPKSDPSLLVVFFAASVAVCALVLPGVSGSFLLLALGLYSPIMGAISDRDPAIMLTFMAGAVCGLAAFIKLLNYLLDNHHVLTLAVMAGFMLGSLRALWPWQDADANLLAPGDNFPQLAGIFLLGSAIVLVIILAERWASNTANEDFAETNTKQPL